jgi:uncharacterized protein DUF4440
MHRTFLTGAISVAMALGTSGAHSWGQEKAKAESKANAKPTSTLAFFAKLEEERNQALVKVDMGALDKLTPEDYTFIDRRGNFLDKTEALDRVKSGQAKMISMTSSDLKVRLYGNTAVVTGRTDVKATLNNRDNSGTVLFTRVYVRRGGRWESVAYQQTLAAKP